MRVDSVLTLQKRARSKNLALLSACSAALLFFTSSCADKASETPEQNAFQEISPCPFPGADDVDPSRLRCGYLTVPENRSDPASDQLKIPVAIVKSASAEPKPDPVVFLHGGPGAAPLGSERVDKLFAGHMFGADRDIIIYNQRGSQMVQPSLDCGEALAARNDAYAQDLTLAQRDEAISDMATSCLRTLVAKGRDLHGYTAQENAADLHDLRTSLGIDQWNLMAVSYGVLMALEAARIDERGVRSLILDSVVSHESDLFMSEANRNFARSIDRLLGACAADAACAQTFPELDEKLSSLLVKLKAAPVAVSLNRADGGVQEIIVNWHDFLNLLHWMLYNSETLRLAPLLISQTEAGDTSLLTNLMDNVFPAPKNGSGGASASFFPIVCNDQYRDRSAFSAQKTRFDGFAITSFMERVCEQPEFEFANRGPLAPTPLETPTLLLAGYFDPMTPDIYAKQAEKNLPQSVFVSIPNFGHSTLSGYTACQTVLAKSFLDELKATEAFSCADDLKGPAFIFSPAEPAPN